MTRLHVTPYRRQVERKPGVVFIGALLAQHAMPRKTKYPSPLALLDNINKRWPGMLKDSWDLSAAMVIARLDVLKRPSGSWALDFELDQPVSEWTVPALALVKGNA